LISFKRNRSAEASFERPSCIFPRWGESPWRVENQVTRGNRVSEMKPERDKTKETNGTTT
jgi:hypothetical protein